MLLEINRFRVISFLLYQSHYAADKAGIPDNGTAGGDHPGAL